MTKKAIQERYFCAYDGKRVFVPNLRKPSTQQYCSPRCEELHQEFKKKHGNSRD